MLTMVEADPRFKGVVEQMRVRLRIALEDRKLSEIEEAALDIATAAGAFLMALNAQQQLHGPLPPGLAAAYGEAHQNFVAGLKALRIYHDIPMN